ncbi:UNVERIFIED_CONTAM: hypothetical protein Sradi_1669300 [Sesamum radiatum]|uniref:Uncharacterized protein n=1 Tax=Sesamum radiatum TaxID=300843 RepID=A0AAW2UFK0_SESRA
MGQPPNSNASPSHPSPPPLPPTELHQSDADEDDQNVKQLRECSTLYLSLQVQIVFFLPIGDVNPKPIHNIRFIPQDCLVNSNRNWKSCQKEVQALKECNDRRKK